MNKELFFAPAIPTEWKIIPNKYLFVDHSEKVGKQFYKYQLLSLTKKGVVAKDINSNEGKLPASFEGYQKVSKGDMIFCLFDLDMSAVFSGLSDLEGMITSAYDVYAINNKLFDSSYCEFWFDYVFSGRYYENYSKNIRYTVGAEMFGQIKTPVPPLEEQRKIGSFLNKKISQIDSLIANQEKQIEKLEEYRQAVITKVVTKGLNPNVKMKDSGVEWIGEISEDWQLPKFKNLAVLSNGKEIEREGGDIPVYGSGGIFKFTNKPLFDGVSLLTGRKGTIDNPMLVNGKFWTVDTMFYTSLIYEQFICPKYLFYAFKGCCNFKFYKSGSVLPSMTQSQINAIAIPLPCKNEQKENVLYLDKKTSILKKIILLKTRQIETLNNYKKSIIYEYVTGKKRVNS